MPSKHAKLSPSAALRWINCPGSIKLSEQCPPPGSSEYAEEGTLAHAVAEAKIQAHCLPDSDGAVLLQKTFDMAEKSQFWCGEMDEATDYYADQVMEIYCEGLKKDLAAEIMAEQRFSLDAWVPDCFGTSDAVVIAGNTIEVIDLKYGKGVKVDAIENPQLRLYGLGAADLFEDIYDFDTVRMTIIQPRLNHVSTEELSLEDLRKWGEEVVKPAAALALDEDQAPVKCGDWCRWCPAKAVCRARAEEQLKLAQKEFADPELLTPEEIGDVLARGEALKKWVADVEEYVYARALAGEHIDGWKLVAGRSVRKYSDELKVAETLQKAGFPEAMLYERKLLGITAMEKLVGKKKFAETLGDLIVKPEGKPVLVPESDERKEIRSAAADFAEEDST